MTETPAPGLPDGFTAATASAAIKKPGPDDMALLRCPGGAALAGDAPLGGVEQPMTMSAEAITRSISEERGGGSACGGAPRRGSGLLG